MGIVQKLKVFSDVYNDGRIEALTKAVSDLIGKNIVIEFTRQ